MVRPRPTRRVVAAGVAGVLVVAALAIGLAEGGGGSTPPDAVPTLAEARADVAGAPPALARLYATPGGTAASGGVPVLDLDRAGFRALLRGLRGRPVLVNAWYPSCPPCRREFPILRTAAATYGTRMAFLGLATEGTTSEVGAFLRGQPTVYPHVLDPDAQITRADLDAGLSFPSTILIDARGEIRGVRNGEYPSLGALEQDLRKVGIRPAAASRAAR
jgi:thiol-disulfide isomerase/thioredoxin